MQGLVHIYCGDGKGKTTAAMGLALRCAGCGEKVVVVQLMKRDNSGERAALSTLPGVRLWETYAAAKFSFQMQPEEKQAAAIWYTEQFQQVVRAVQKNVRLLILDEIVSCIACGFLPEQAVLEFLQARPAGLEVVLTGRDPSEALLAQADYVTEMKKGRHPYDRGVAARQGIEY